MPPNHGFWGLGQISLTPLCAMNSGVRKSFKMDKNFLREYLRNSRQYTIAREDNSNDVSIKIKRKNLMKYLQEIGVAEVKQSKFYPDDQLALSRVT